MPVPVDFFATDHRIFKIRPTARQFDGDIARWQLQTSLDVVEKQGTG